MSAARALEWGGLPRLSSRIQFPNAGWRIWQFSVLARGSRLTLKNGRISLTETRRKTVSRGSPVRYLPICLLLFGLPLLPVATSTGIKMTGHTIFGGHSTERTVYIQGDHKREEFRNGMGHNKADGSEQWIEGPRLAMITRCDLGQIFELNLDSAQYEAAPYPPKPLTKEEIEARGLKSQLKIPQISFPPKPTVRVETKTTDTGERKEMFGHIARHVITTIKYTPLAGGRSEPRETVIDGWYIDTNFNLQLPCDRRWPEGTRDHAFMSVMVGNQPPEWPEFIQIGKPETGSAVQTVSTTTITHTLPDGTKKQRESKYESLTTDLKEGPLNPALFEVPAGFKRVEHIEQNPTLPISIQLEDFWTRLKAKVAGLLRP